MIWHHFAANFEATTLTNYYNAIKTYELVSQISQDSISKINLCGGTSSRSGYCAMSEMRLWSFVRSPDLIASTMHWRLKLSESADALYYFHLDGTENIENNLLINSGGSSGEIPVTTTEFKVMRYKEGFMDALPHPPVCENNEVYLSNEGQCK